MKHFLLRAVPAAALALAVPSMLTGQVPDHLVTVELERSRSCVPVLGRLDALNEALTPLAIRSQRLLAIGQAVALEDDAVVETLDSADPVEAAVRAWFVADAALAERIVQQATPELQDERAAGREAIQTTITEALEAVQARADSTITATGDLQQHAGRCTGATLVRGAVLESCGSTSSPVCDAARDTTAGGTGFRFVDSAESIWDVQELRAWTAPGPLTVSANGQIGGARTVGATRMGNVAVNVALTPWLQERSTLAEEASTRVQALTDSLGFGGGHPDVVFVPSLVVRASLPESLGGESDYLFHFGPPESADVVWQAGAGSGADVEGVVPLAPSHLLRLRAGEPMTLTAVREAEDGELDALWAIELTSLNQANAVSGLLGYMANQLPADLAALLPPDNS
ncbi:MAG TPA: hypothetical protein VMM35_08290 [Longimicrobiales bacterium]|nr:hypothetical protein [Longimicrobiales bacterium]